MTPLPLPNLHRFLAMFIVLVTLAACGGESEPDEDRSFAPETNGEEVAPSNTPAPTSTFAPIDIQPGEDSPAGEDGKHLVEQTGSATNVLGGFSTLASVDVASGEQVDLGIARVPTIVAALSADGKLAVVIERAGEAVSVRVLDGKGAEVAAWAPESPSTPVASPEAAPARSQTGDRAAWNTEGSRVAVWLSGLGLFIGDATLQMSPVPNTASASVTALAWSPSGQSLAVGLWNADRSSSSIVTVNADSPANDLRIVVETIENDRRFVRSLAWGNERVGIVFALRTVGSNVSRPNDLYMVPRFGEPMQLLATAGVAAPAAVVDQIAIAADGNTVAFTVLVPGEVGLRFHSAWVTDALNPRPFRVDTTGLRRVTDLVWTVDGLVASGTARTQDDANAYQVIVVGRLNLETPEVIATAQSPATPVGSPVASPVGGSPVPDD